MAPGGPLEQQPTTPGSEAITGHRPLIAVAGSTSASTGAEALARALGEALVSAGYRIACGGLGGVMAATARGARRSEAWTGNEVMGLLPGWDVDEGNAWIDIPLRTGLGRYRNMLLASACDALVAVEGGAGTLSEMALAWQEDRPLLVLGSAGTSGRIAGAALDHRRPDPVPAYDDVAALMMALDRLFPLGCFGSRGHTRWFHEEVPCLHRVHDDQRPPAPTSAHGLQVRLGFSMGRDVLRQELLELDEQLHSAQPAGAPRRKLLVTFDDGYRDILELVPWFRQQPQLQPVVMVSTATLRGEPHWFDLLYQALSEFCAKGHTIEEALRARSDGLAASLRAVAAGRAAETVLSWVRDQGLPPPEVLAGTYPAASEDIPTFCVRVPDTAEHGTAVVWLDAPQGDQGAGGRPGGDSIPTPEEHRSPGGNRHGISDDGPRELDGPVLVWRGHLQSCSGSSAINLSDWRQVPYLRFRPALPHHRPRRSGPG